MEKKIVAGLVAGGIASVEIAEMLAETESAITKADAAALQSGRPKRSKTTTARDGGSTRSSG